MSIVSVIIPIFNCEAYIPGLMTSLCGQTHRELEIVCAVDGATDRSADLCREWAARDSRIRVLSLPHRGAGEARNAGLDAAGGDYVIFLDADDLYPETFIARMAEAADRYQADVTVCQFIRQNTVTGERNVGFGFLTSRIPFTAGPPQEIPDLFNTVNATIHNKLFRLSFLRETGLRFSDTARYNDAFFAHAALVSAKTAAFISDSLYTYRLCHSPHSISSGNAHQEDLFTVYEELWQWLLARGLEKKYEQTFIKRWRKIFYYVLSLGVDETFIREAGRHLATRAPFCEKKGAAFVRAAGLTSFKANACRIRARLALLHKKRPLGERPGTENQEGSRRKSAAIEIRDCSRILRHLAEIRRELASRWGIHASSYPLRSIIWDVRDQWF